MTSPFKRPKLTTTQVGAAGEHFVAAEILRRRIFADFALAHTLRFDSVNK